MYGSTYKKKKKKSLAFGKACSTSLPFSDYSKSFHAYSQVQGPLSVILRLNQAE